MEINRIKEALATMAAKVEPMAELPVAQPKSETKATTAPVKNPSTTKSTRTRSTVSESVPQKTPALVNQTAPAVPKPSTPKTSAATMVAPIPMTVAPAQTDPTPVEPEPKAVVATPKKTTTRKAKTATVIPIDSIEVVVAKHLKAKLDFDTISGCGRKPVLLKAGAEKLAEIYGLRTTSKVINRVERFDQLFVLYEVQTTVYDADGNIVAEGIGSCNTKERRYQKGDFAANLNTVLKMAKKRSYVDSILTATHASRVFTQDIEDIAVEVRQAEAVG